MTDPHAARILLPSPSETAPDISTNVQSKLSRSSKSDSSDPFLAKTDAARWTILSSRTCPPSAQPPFVYAVLTTHIYCRPTCPARLARRANITFFDTPADAVKAGFRACKRCKPDVVPQVDGRGGELITAGDGEEGRRKVLRAVEIIQDQAAAGHRVGLRELSEEVGLSRWHLLRIFRKRWGVTPKEMADGVMNEKQQQRGNRKSSGKSESGLRTPETVATGSSAESAMPVTPETGGFEGGGGGGGAAGAAFDDAFMDFDLVAMQDVDFSASDLWGEGESAEELLRDLFPEVYQQDTKARA